ncbi:MAG: DEAD/DEAH box helicase, partial [Candidatus Hydrogenedentes bacterium]|nr:DEAD/DEAH box helicase [Candidatus Hydrogenedentota bacterium]
LQILPNFLDKPIGESGIEVVADLPPGLPLREVKASSALLERWFSDILEFFIFLHSQQPNAVALGRVDIDQFEIHDGRVRLVDLALDVPPVNRSIAQDIEGLTQLARDLVPSAAAAIDAFRPSSAHELRRVLEAVGQETAPAKECYCGERNSPLVRFCVRCGASFAGAAGVSSTILLEVDADSSTNVAQAWDAGQVSALSRMRIAERMDALRQSPGFDRLICLERLPRLDRMPYQEKAALRVLRGMRGRALLADEVGLGKTIEAGLVLKELLDRGLIESALVLCPQSLMNQWQNELFEKFDEFFLVLGRDVDSTLAWRCDRVIASYAALEQRWHAEELSRRSFDLVILDEAHYLNQEHNVRALEMVRSLRKTYFLLLSATPMHNDIEELHKILTLLRPGHAGTEKDFLARHHDPENPSIPRDLDHLRNTVKEVMIRNLRTQVAQDHHFPTRIAIRRVLNTPPEGLAAYQTVQHIIKTEASSGPLRSLLVNRGGIAERLVSSRDALKAQVGRLSEDLARRGGKEFLQKLRRACDDPHIDTLIEPKIDEMLNILRARVTCKDETRRAKVLVFSQFNKTARILFNRIKENGIPVLIYDEEEDSRSREAAIAEFSRCGPCVLVCPGEAEEGLNLQMASVMVNFDLPWDPMRIEQRIGRIQRLGNASSEVEIVNLVLEGTIEDDIVEMLENKIRMFEAVIGPLQAILGNLEKSEDPHRWIEDIFLDATIMNDAGESVDARVHADRVIDDARNRLEESQNNMLNDLFQMDEEELEVPF